MTKASPGTTKSPSSAERVTVVADTREQEPYAFDPEAVDVVRRALPAGDYSLPGYEASIAVERKTLADYVSSVIRSRGRFLRELRALAEYDLGCVVVEAMGCGLPVAAYRSKGPADIVEHCLSGFLEVGPENLAKYIAVYFSDASLMERMSHAATKRSKHYDAEKIMSRFMKDLSMSGACRNPASTLKSRKVINTDVQGEFFYDAENVPCLHEVQTNLPEPAIFP